MLIKLTQQRLHELVDYDYATGEFTWKAKTSNHSARVNIGDKIGWIGVAGYRHTELDGGSYRCHRLVWLYVHGKFPEAHLDHLDGDRANNRIENLRECSSSGNAKNKTKQSNNTSGFTGVKLQRLKRKSGKINERWVAKWCESVGTSNTKSFSVFKYGYEQAKEMAISYRDNKIKEMKQAGDAYTERHGL